ncbi:MAG: DUF2797 domain-containing protein [Candidatus Freyarchaeota archaeon]|nr:DUF2797 domain-containing protein [Candidatus Jordarchaeia archaeon]MBS7268221.1 DUF2797 domain-containing protein [Candidatus Jordarchaeia archaeon]MBS7279329.1 DUF2797 domain-containing protein [Candidatus Jordarchaeia archaeon]
MTITITQQIITPHPEETPQKEDTQFIVRGYSWRPFLGITLPHLDLLTPQGLGSAPLFGEHTLTLTKEKYCLECQNPTNTQYCPQCQKLPKIQRLECITKGAGTPYNQQCNPKNPPCNSPWAAQHCGEEHVIYIAGFGELFKVGVTRTERWSEPDGYKYRLIEQGADCATVLRGNLNLATAQETEQLIADALDLETRVVFDYKVAEFSNPKGPKITELRKLSQEAARRFGLHIVCTLDLSQVYGVRPELMVDMSIWQIEDLLGKVVYVRGNILYLQSCSLLVAYDLSSARGKGVICEED